MKAVSRKLAHLIALVVPLAVAGCYSYYGSPGDSSSDDDDFLADDDDGSPPSPPSVTSLQCVAEMSNVTVLLGQPETVQLQAVAEFEDGTSGFLEVVDWSIVDDFGGSVTSSGLYTTPANHGGLVAVEALHQLSGLVAQCYIEVHLEATDNVTEDPALVDPLHGVSTTTDDSCAAVLSYPLDGAVLPTELAAPRFMWTVPGASNTSVLELTTQYVRVTVVTHETSWTPEGGQWFALTEPNSGEPLKVRIVTGTWDNGLSAFTDTPCEATSQVTLGVSPIGVLGNVYYWNPETEGLWTVGIGASQAVSWLGSDTGPYCVGCHSVNLHNPDRMAVNFGGGNRWAGVVDVNAPNNPVLPAETRHGNFFTLNPDGTRLVRSYHGVLYLDDIDNDVEIGILPTTGYASHPDWSPDGTRIVYSSCGSNNNDWNVWNCGIHHIDVLPNGSFGADSPLVPSDSDWNYYYPSFSPDSSWVSFNRHAGNDDDNNSNNNDGAEVMIVPVWGGAPILLAQASMPGRCNSWPRWGPGQGEYGWLSFSSRRPYGSVTNGNAQVWMSAIDFNLAVQGVDPSFPPIWLPGQDPAGSNHTPVWVPRYSAP